MNILTYTDARNGLAGAMDRVVQDREATVITRTGREAVVMVALEEWNAIQATLHLLSSPRNADRLHASIAELDAGDGEERGLNLEDEIRDPRLG
ncbi:antitoxin YefM [Pseudorhodobacter antarcticus]|uniref:Antitoxin n=1 Tax=Pseudorhodobacter antarcticus TaxID=1077947 RepID=A0A1H8D8X5_9RHOB|nr:type II toxin-antitoxin system prevent-host-death family antitoxin [Pseudorhodobacter antarcticus]SEN03028.1 antitoxin YefM [Pseudorhodobacter antarcticus]